MLRTEGSLRVDDVLVGTLTIAAARDTGLPVLLTTLLPACALAVFCVLVAWGARTAERRRVAAAIGPVEAAAAALVRG
ncbi:hypothetical protein ABTD35_21805, partial [Acinetobacter baumannii]